MSLLQIKNFLKNKNIEIDVRKEAFFLSTFFLKPDKRKDLSINTNFSKFVEDDQVTEEKYSEIKLYREEFVEKYPDLQLGFLPFKRETLDRIMGLILDTSFWDIIFFGQEKKYDDLRNIINYWISKAKINDKVTLGLIEAEKFLFSYPDLFSKFDSDINIYLGDKYLYYIFKFLYESNNKISIYKIHNRGGPENYLEGIELHDENYCWAFPERSRKFSYEDINEEFKSSRKEIIALGNILNSLGDNSILNILLPVGFTFINDTKYMRNNFILDSKNINLKEVFALPKIKNYTSTNVCSLKFEKKQKEEKESIILGRLEKDNSSFKIIDKIELDYDNEMLRTTWRIDDYQQDYKGFAEIEKTNKIKIGDFATVLRGKNVTKKIKTYDKEKGDFLVINLSDVDDGRIEFSEDVQYAIEKKPKAFSRYEIEEEDVIIACRGTVLKAGYIPSGKELEKDRYLPVFIDERSKNIIEDKNFKIIASVNYLILRVEDKSRFEPKFLNIFFNSKWGKILLSKIQRGKTVKNINMKDLESLEIPFYTKKKQFDIIESYEDNELTFLKAKNKYNESRKLIEGNLKEFNNLRERAFNDTGNK